MQLRSYANSALLRDAEVKHGLLEQLHQIVGGPGLVVGADVASRYPGVFMPGTNADAVVKPRSTEQISRILAACNVCEQPVVVQDMSSGVREARTAAGDIVLSLERMNAIERIDPFNRTALVQAGVPLQAFQERVADHGLSFPLEQSGLGPRHLGGNAATNAGGMRMIRYGTMRNRVLGMEVVLADGRIISSLHQVMTSTAGYDLKQLFIGSEGTLGVIARLVLRLHENPLRCSTALVSVERFDQIVKLLRTMDRALSGSLSAFEFLNQQFYALSSRRGRSALPLAEGCPLYVIIEAIGADEVHHELFEKALRLALEDGLIVDAMIAKSEADRRAIWNLRENLAHIVHDYQPFYVFAVILPVTNMEAYMESVQKRIRKRWPDASISFLGDLAAGNIYIASSVGTGSEEDRISVECSVYEPLASFDGSISAERIVRVQKEPYLHVNCNPGERRVMRDLKSLFDPKGILNPGRMFDRYPRAPGKKRNDYEHAR